jgi:hypothetical protein
VDSGLKSGHKAAENQSMLFLLALLTAGYFAGVVWLCRNRRAVEKPAALPIELPQDDRPPASAVGWPPQGTRFEQYVDEGVAALDAYLADGYAA